MRVRSRRRTLYSLLAGIGLAASIFMYFQFFSISVIDIQRRHSDTNQGNGPKHSLNDDFDKYNLKAIPDMEKTLDCHGDKCVPSKKDMESLKVELVVPHGQHKDPEGVRHVENIEDSIIIRDLPRGAPRALASRYKAGTAGIFSCIHSEETIPFAEVNDDYCDCADGSDEPGTSACPHTRFTCTFQSRGVKAHDIPSSKVNDGICDCCDGSDEWKNITLPSHVALEDNIPHYGVYQVPCQNRCQREIALSKEVLLIHQQGAALKQNYVKFAEGQENPNKLYGPSGEFYKLSQNCYNTKSDKYEYTVCPFRDVKQQAFPAAPTLIGRTPEWAELGGTNGWTLRMTHGDSKQCPGGIQREAILQFECGLADNILNVQETEVCQYTIKFSTPAAC